MTETAGLVEECQLRQPATAVGPPMWHKPRGAAYTHAINILRTKDRHRSPHMPDGGERRPPSPRPPASGLPAPRVSTPWHTPARVGCHC
ncbi:hypothetical protein AUP68_06782 [Ilyonectria robusta]